MKQFISDFVNKDRVINKAEKLKGQLTEFAEALAVSNPELEFEEVVTMFFLLKLAELQEINKIAHS